MKNPFRQSTLPRPKSIPISRASIARPIQRTKPIPISQEKRKTEEAPDPTTPSTEVKGRRRNAITSVKATHDIPPDDTTSRPREGSLVFLESEEGLSLSRVASKAPLMIPNLSRTFQEQGRNRAGRGH
ncbi:hypothetical protein U1Q18_017026 [Sarracenia purpurea var. burkii]